VKLSNLLTFEWGISSVSKRDNTEIILPYSVSTSILSFLFTYFGDTTSRHVIANIKNFSSVTSVFLDLSSNNDIAPKICWIALGY